jgi:hypothetical protein
MTKYGFLAALPFLALGAPAFAQQQPVLSSVPAVVDGAPTSVPAAVAIHTDPLTGDRIATLVLPPAPGVIAPSEPSADAVWEPGHYEWSRRTATYVWLPSHYIEQTPVGATWIAGHWQERPGHWIWVDGHWD